MNESTAANPATDAAEVWGLMAEFENPAAISRAAEAIRDEGYTSWDVYSPFPIHGMDEAMGLRLSKVTWIMGGATLTGFSLALWMQWWMSSQDYPLVTGGKPLDAWEPFTPILFELSVLLSAFGALLGMLALNLLPRWHHPLMTKERFLRVGDDRFVIAIEARDPKFDAGRTRALLESLGGFHVDVVEDQ